MQIANEMNKTILWKIDKNFPKDKNKVRKVWYYRSMENIFVNAKEKSRRVKATSELDLVTFIEPISKDWKG